MDLNINSVIPYYNQTGEWIDPIDTLQTKFNLWYEEEFEYSLGDINQDSIIDILDVINLINAVLGENITGYRINKKEIYELVPAD